MEKEQELAVKNYIPDLNKKYKELKNKKYTLYFTIHRNYQRNRIERARRRKEKIFKEAFTFNASFFEQRMINKVD